MPLCQPSGGLPVTSGIFDSQAYQVNAALRQHGLAVAGPEHAEQALQLGEPHPQRAS
jgi:ribosomal protein L11 methylase PrmA